MESIQKKDTEELLLVYSRHPSKHIESEIPIRKPANEFQLALKLPTCTIKVDRERSVQRRAT